MLQLHNLMILWLLLDFKVTASPRQLLKVFFFTPLRPPLLRPELRSVNAGEQATNCKNQKCHLPDCLCGQTRLKGKIKLLRQLIDHLCVAFAKVHSRQYWLKRQKFNLLILQVFIKNQIKRWNLQVYGPRYFPTLRWNLQVCKNWGCHSLKSFLPFVQRQQKYYTRYFFGTAKVIDGVPFWVARKVFRILPDFHALRAKNILGTGKGTTLLKTVNGHFRTASRKCQCFSYALLQRWQVRCIDPNWWY